MVIKLPEGFCVNENRPWFGFVPIRNRFGTENGPIRFATKVFEWCDQFGHRQGNGKK